MRFYQVAVIVIICLTLVRFLHIMFFYTKPQSLRIEPIAHHHSTYMRFKWDREEALDTNGRLTLQWNFTEDEITMKVTAATKGYVAIGFALKPEMAPSDIVIGWVNQDKVYLEDFYAVGKSRPIRDPEQNLELLFGTENHTHTTFCFKRKLNTCDKNDINITSSHLYLLWSFHDEDPENDSSDKLLYHGRNRGFSPLHLLDYDHQITSKEDVDYYDIGANNAKIIFKWMPFYYWCRFIEVPNFGEKRHLIGYEALIQPEHHDLIHHIVVFQCEGGFRKKKLLNITEGYLCNVPWAFSQERACNKKIITWAVGSKATFLPSHVGYPFGSSKENPMYLMIQIHYNFKRFIPGLKDSSKLRLYHTRHLRPNDASAMIAFVKYFELIPGRQKDFPTIGICSPTCTKQHFPPEGIHIFRVRPHAHETVTSLRLHHFRNGVEINTFSEDNYQFKHQVFRPLKKEMTILPNDWFAVECLHDTMNRTKLTVTGLGSEDEMCFITIEYYPPVDLALCTSSLETKAFQRITENYYFSKRALVDLELNPYLFLPYFMMMQMYLREKQLIAKADTIKEMYLKGNHTPFCVSHHSGWIYYTDEVIQFSQAKTQEVKDECLIR